MIRMMQTEDHITGPVNIGNPVKYTMLELAETIVAMTGSKSRITFLPLPPDDPIHRQPDIGLAKDILDGWAPRIDLEQGLELTIAYFQNLLNN
jgi:UDP-glucuronate decarboxylase